MTSTSDDKLSSFKQEFSEILISGLSKTINKYFEGGSRSSKKTDELNATIYSCIEKIIRDKYGGSTADYKLKCECNVKSLNQSNAKKCDIVVFKNDKPFLILPLKFCMTNYKQNKNNYWEGLTGEVCHLSWANPDIKIIPVNIVMNKIPYLKKNSTIEKWEEITFENSFGIYSNLVSRGIAHSMYNVIIDVNHTCNINEAYNKAPEILSINESVSLYDVLFELF